VTDCVLRIKERDCLERKGFDGGIVVGGI
jgi:hypothetical protein